MKKLTQKELKSQLDYNLYTGVFTWINPKSKVIRKGSKAGNTQLNGYVYIQINKSRYLAHRLAFLYVEGYFPENQVDHKNRIRNDNRWDNLKEVSPSCNSRNRKIAKNNLSGINGVWYDKRAKKWRTSIIVFKKVLDLGVYNEKVEAVKARWEAEKKYDYPNCNTTSSAFLYLQKFKNRRNKISC